ncbi:unnamed protein product [Rotaria magnacalcarata]|uniref:Uncharacterized protein n=1 Tax=Rotaria magnacalcarata TaxID=392030 RepID=A0A819DQU2_9BILA|nr:unnamed protein product [Rotaria magnacalcarata]CAF1648501.1 unnamed protein product [Rotaria magnacalcarata]CAF2126682.1 unnamed protein product [Rotaria magnacalcarata]CAF2163914.1 unnamed protein product [Rotaria magnacalcarata]CAF3780511.1 unnamed protein product [Rotaria magnacalcarata]
MEDTKVVNIDLSLQSKSPPEIYIKLTNNSLVLISNFTQIDTYYLLFSSELICRFSCSKNVTTCFYYPSSMHFIQIEQHFDHIINVSLALSSELHHRFIIIFITIVYHHINQIDYTIDPQLAKATELKFVAEPT